MAWTKLTKWPIILERDEKLFWMLPANFDSGRMWTTSTLPCHRLSPCQYIFAFHCWIIPCDADIRSHPDDWRRFLPIDDADAGHRHDHPR